jgi:transcriptional regulator with XRE-family HTH domain
MDLWPQREFFRKILQEYQDKTGKSHADVAEALGLAKTSFRGILYQKGVKPSLAVLQKASALFGVSVKKFIADPGGSPYDNSDVYPVPKLKLHGSAVCEDEAVYGEIYFVDNGWIRMLNVNPKDLRYFDIDSDCMEPYFYSNDRVFVDLNAFDSGFKAGVWMIRTGDTVMAKRIQMIGPNRYQASSDNPVYPPFTLEGTSQLLGRVVSLERIF